MDNLTFFITLTAIGLGTFLMRGSFILSADKFKLSEKFTNILRFIPASVLAALVAPSFFYHQGTVDPLQGKERLVAGLTALFIACLTRNIFYTIFSGMVALYGLQYFF